MTQVFRPLLGAHWIVGVVGQLQLDVLAVAHGLRVRIAVTFEPSPYETARWVASDDAALLKRFIEERRASMAEDRDGAPVFLARNAWELERTAQEWPGLRFLETHERT